MLCHSDTSFRTAHSLQDHTLSCHRGKPFVSSMNWQGYLHKRQLLFFFRF